MAKFMDTARNNRYRYAVSAEPDDVLWTLNIFDLVDGGFMRTKFFKKASELLNELDRLDSQKNFMAGIPTHVYRQIPNEVRLIDNFDGYRQYHVGKMTEEQIKSFELTDYSEDNDCIIVSLGPSDGAA